MYDRSDPAAIAAALAAPFNPTEVKFKPQTVSGNRALAVPFVDARVVQDRLDDVLGVMGWQDSYECLPDGAVVCRLSIRLATEWITKMDVGSPSEQPDEGDRRKAAFSDALKRAAVKFGIGRYLYRSRPVWVDFDPVKKQFTQTPRLPLPEAVNGRIGNGQALNGNGNAKQTAGKPASVLADAKKDDAELVTRQQINQLESLCKSRGKSVSALCRRFGVGELAQLSADDYRKAVDGLTVLLPGPAVRAAARTAS